MQWKRTDIDKKAYIIESLIAWKLWSDIARETWMNESIVSRIKSKDLPEVARTSTAISTLIDRNNKLQASADALIAEMIADKAESVTIAQLTGLRNSTFTQNQLMQGKATERIEIWDYSTMSDKELEKERNNLLI